MGPHDAQAKIVSLLRSTLAEGQARNPSFSLRAFSRRLGITPAELSLILNGKRRITSRMAERLLDRLSLDPAMKHGILEAVPARLPRKKRAGGEVLNYIQLSTDEFRVVADWYYLAILSLSETRGFVSEVTWIARRLRIRTEDARTAVETLLRLRLLQEERRGALVRWKPTGNRFTTTNDISDASIRKNHAQALELAREALDTVPVDLREFGASVIAADPALLPAAKKKLREARREVARLLESGSGKEVYRLSVQLIPLSHPVTR